MPQNYGSTPTGDVIWLPTNAQGDITLPEYANRLPNGEPDLFGFDGNGNPTRHWLPGTPPPPQRGPGITPPTSSSVEQVRSRRAEEDARRRANEQRDAELKARLMNAVEQLQEAGVAPTPRRIEVACSRKPGWFGGVKKLWGNFEPAWLVGDCTWREANYQGDKDGGRPYLAPSGVTPSGKVVPMDRAVWATAPGSLVGDPEAPETYDRDVRGKRYFDWIWYAHHTRVSPGRRDPEEWERIIAALKQLLP